MVDHHETRSEYKIMLRLGTRKSPLAMAQAEEVRNRLCRAHGWEAEAVELVPIEASGDRIQDRALAEIGGKALWTKELDAWLYRGHIDAAVHSMKDVETIRPNWLVLGAVLPRADIRDVLIGASGLMALPQEAVVGTSAPRRAAQLLYHRPDCRVVMFRGNVATRLAKLDAGKAEATFLAAAGLKRLGEERIGTPLDVGEWLPAPAQGAIGIECRANDTRIVEMVAAINDPVSRATVEAERAMLRGLGGTCQSSVAAVSEYEDGMINLTASLFAADGTERVDGAARFAASDIGKAQELAFELLDQAPAAIRKLFDGK